MDIVSKGDDQGDFIAAGSVGSGEIGLSNLLDPGMVGGRSDESHDLVALLIRMSDDLCAHFIAEAVQFFDVFNHFIMTCMMTANGISQELFRARYRGIESGCPGKIIVSLAEYKGCSGNPEQGYEESFDHIEVL